MKNLKLIILVNIVIFSLYSISLFANSEPIITSSINISKHPNKVIVNNNTNMIYVYDNDEKIISIINGSGSIVKTLYNIIASDFTINETTNKIYTNGFSVIDSNNNTVKHSSLDFFYENRGIAINSKTDTVYIANIEDNNIYVFSGADNNTLIKKIPDSGLFPSSIAINSKTNMIYVSSYGSDSVSVIDGNTNTIKTIIRVGGFPQGIAVNPNTNTIYVTNRDSNTISVIDGATNTPITTIGVGDNPDGIAVNPNTNTIYVTNSKSNTVSVIDGINNELINTINVGKAPSGIAINLETNILYVANFYSNNISIIRNPNSTLYKDSQTNSDPWRQYKKTINDQMDNVFAKLDKKFGIFPSIDYAPYSPYEDYMESVINKIDTLLKTKTLSEKNKVLLDVVKYRLERKIYVLNTVF